MVTEQMEEYERNHSKQRQGKSTLDMQKEARGFRRPLADDEEHRAIVRDFTMGGHLFVPLNTHNIFIRVDTLPEVETTDVLLLQFAQIGSMSIGGIYNKVLWIHAPRDQEGSHRIQFTSSEAALAFVDKVTKKLADYGLLVTLEEEA